MKYKKSGYYVLDSRNINKKVDPNSVNVIITSPPYWDLKDYEVDDQIGKGQKYDTEYMKDIIKIFDNCFDLTKHTGSMWIVIDTIKKKGEMITLPFDLVTKLKEIQNDKIKMGIRKKGERWYLQDIIIWKKNKTLPWSHKGKVRKIFEYILFFSKSKKDFKYLIDNIRDPINLKHWWKSHPERYNPRGKVPTQIWDFDIITQGWGNTPIKHACPFPAELVERIILLTTNKGDLVLDPFAGSGSVLAQADVLNRKYLGFDLNSKYKKTFNGEILPTIRREEKDKEEKGLTLTKKQDRRELEIIGLRKLKYAKEILRNLFKTEPNLKTTINFIFVFSNNPTRHNCEIFYVFEDMSTKKQIISDKIFELQNQQIFRKYGLKAKIELVNKDNTMKIINAKQKYYKYSKGNFKSFCERIVLEDVSEEKNKFPDIISNIRVNVK